MDLNDAIIELLRLRSHMNEAGGLLTVTSIANRYGITRARASEITQAEDFPPAVWVEGRSKFWTVNSVDAWRAESRRVGRPPGSKEINHAEAEAGGLTNYVVVTRKDRIPVDRFVTLEAAANYIVREKAFARWTVMAQEGNKITASTPYRKLRPTEQRRLEEKLYPTLFE